MVVLNFLASTGQTGRLNPGLQQKKITKKVQKKIFFQKVQHFYNISGILINV